MEESSGILSALIVEKNVMFYLLFFIVLVAALCILSAQITFVIQKTREIGMLKALGATKLQISGIFLAQSAIIGVIGVASGYGSGHVGGGVSERISAFHAQRDRLGIVSGVGLWLWRTARAHHAERRGDHLHQFVCDLHFRRPAAGGPRRKFETGGGAAL